MNRMKILCHILQHRKNKKQIKRDRQHVPDQNRKRSSLTFLSITTFNEKFIFISSVCVKYLNRHLEMSCASFSNSLARAEL